MPVSWDEIWGKLAWRFSRPHQPEIATAADVTMLPHVAANAASGPFSNVGYSCPVSRNVGDSNYAMRVKGALEHDLPIPEQLALINGATGIDDSKALKRQAVKALKLRSDIDVMVMPPLLSGRLVFVQLDAFEGEFKIGLGRIERVEDDEAEIQWFEPRGLRKYTYHQPTAIPHIHSPVHAHMQQPM